MATPHSRPVTIALVDDYDVVLSGLAKMFEPYRDRVTVVELDANESVDRDVDVVMYDTFAQAEADRPDIGVLIDSARAHRVVVYTWNFQPDLIKAAREAGVDGYLSKTLPARDLVSALEKVHAGETVVSEAPTRTRAPSGLDWPGRAEGLTDRESEILSLITQGKNNAEVAALTYLAPNTVKSYIRSTYRKIGAKSRTQAVLWGVRHGFTPDHDRLGQWDAG